MGLAKRATVAAVAILLGFGAGNARAQIGVGTWVRTEGNINGPRLMMTIEECCGGGRRMIYRMEGSSAIIQIVETGLDGRDSPVLVGGKPTGQTMAMKQLDPLHSVTVLKTAGRPFGTARATVSADGNTMTVENELTEAQPGHIPGRSTERWVRRK
jgi:hypothetical protein